VIEQLRNFFQVVLITQLPSLLDVMQIVQFGVFALQLATNNCLGLVVILALKFRFAGSSWLIYWQVSPSHFNNLQLMLSLDFCILLH